MAHARPWSRLEILHEVAAIRDRLRILKNHLVESNMTKQVVKRMCSEADNLILDIQSERVQIP